MNDGRRIRQWVLPTNHDTERLGAALGAAVRSGDLILLFGQLGAGKTTFTRGIARGIGIDQPVMSPTFTLVREHPGALPLFHMDFYRLTRAEEAEEAGLADYLQRAGVCVIEWPECALDALPDDRLELYFSVFDDDARAIQAVSAGRRAEDLLDAWEACHADPVD